MMNSSRDQSILIIPCVLIVSLCAYVLSVKPMLSQRKTLKANYAALQEKALRAKRDINEKDLIELRYQALRHKVPDTEVNEDPQSFGRQLNELSLDQGLNVTSIQPFPMQLESSYQTETYKLTLEGHIDQILGFVDCIDMSHEPVRIVRLNVQSGHITDRVKATFQVSKVVLN
jgi:Tfp pilus assembly protein PilO